MDDARVWEFEESLWTGGPDRYQKLVDDEVLMVLPQPPFVQAGQQAIDAVSKTPQWDKAKFSDQNISRPQEGLIVVAYTMEASREGEEPYKAHCTSTYRRLSHDEWRVVQHQQTLPLAKVV